jgi:hypothetical protein
MIESNKATLTLNWLKTKLIKQENGILLNDNCSCCFEAIQNFIASVDHPLKTPAIYYEAFPEESAAQFLNTLNEELASKLGYPQLESNQSLCKTIEMAALKMVIIDQSYLHPLDTLEKIINFLASCHVCLILVGCREKLEIAQILTNPLIFQWEQFQSYDQYEALPKFC